MRQWKVRPNHDPPLSLMEAVHRDPGPGEVLIRVHAASLNFRDQLLLTGRYSTGRDQPVVPLSDGAGEVIGIGRGVTRVKVGDRVTATTITNWIDGRFEPSMGAGSIGFSLDGWLSEVVVLPETALSSSDAKLERAYALGADLGNGSRRAPGYGFLQRRRNVAVRGRHGVERRHRNRADRPRRIHPRTGDRRRVDVCGPDCKARRCSGSHHFE